MSEVLSCWKEIAQYVGKGVRTVQRWERIAGFPVRRPMPGCNAVLAYTDELDSWLGRAHEVGEVAELRARVAELTALNEELRWQLALRAHLAGDEAGVFASQELRDNCETLRAHTAQLSSTGADERNRERHERRA